MTQTKSTKTASNKKTKQPEDLTVAELELSLKRMKNAPEEYRQDVKRTKKDIERAKKEAIITCAVFGVFSIYNLGRMIYGIVVQKADTICLAALALIINLLVILYEVRDYQNRKNFLEMYLLSRQVLAAWSKMTIEGLNREVALALRIEELEKEKKNGATKKAKASK